MRTQQPISGQDVLFVTFFEFVNQIRQLLTEIRLVPEQSISLCGNGRELRTKILELFPLVVFNVNKERSDVKCHQAPVHPELNECP